MIKVQNEVPAYEVDDREVSPMLAGQTITVRSHWNRGSLVVLAIEGKRLTVAAKELHAAIDNATNTARF